MTPDSGSTGEDTKATGREPAAGTQSLLRGLAILDCVAGGIDDAKGIAAALGKPRSTVHRMLAALVAQGYLHHLPYKGYIIGPKLIGLGLKGLEQRPLAEIARPHLETLARDTSDTVHLAVIEGEALVYLAKLPGLRSLEMRSQVGKRMPVASTGVGKGMMLGLPGDSWRGFYDAAVATEAAHPALPPWDAYAARMARYRQQGWALDFEENEIGIRCVGAPVFDMRSRAVAGISVASAVPFMPPERMDRLGPRVRAAADAISRDLGWSGETIT
ncbi:IclR family transcriptional regulator [Tropicimonas sp. IMCC34043]|uniref:IclR family transcriptional regulator n=1 Tax=Tropicimonas sp. IMCC34043 TaxID=2248760 RepID=UPI000E25535A|nr:IclR family transcriptional regulator [Tropicimonas sp. IMCC34043]